MTSEEIIKCKDCMHWDTDNAFTKKDFYGNCTAFLGDDVYIHCKGGWEGCVIEHVETESNFYCAAGERR